MEIRCVEIPIFIDIIGLDFQEADARNFGFAWIEKGHPEVENTTFWIAPKVYILVLYPHIF